MSILRHKLEQHSTYKRACEQGVGTGQGREDFQWTQEQTAARGCATTTPNSILASHILPPFHRLFADQRDCRYGRGAEAVCEAALCLESFVERHKALAPY